MNQTAMLTDFARNTDMDLLMVAGRYTLLEQPALDELLPLCEQRGIGVVAAGVFNSGLLAREGGKRILIFVNRRDTALRVAVTLPWTLATLPTSSVSG